MTPENDAIDRFLIYHPPGTGKSLTALWILYNFIEMYNKPTIILLKSKESFDEFQQRVNSWYNYTFKFYDTLSGVNNGEEFTKKYIKFHSYITFCRSLNDDDYNSIFENRLIIIDEVHHFQSWNGDKYIYERLLNFLNKALKTKIVFMSATPIFDNYNEITSLVKLIKPNIKLDHPLTPEKLEKIRKGHVSYYGVNPLETSVNIIGSVIPGIEQFEIFTMPMSGLQLENYQKMNKGSNKLCNVGINYVKGTLGVIDYKESNEKKKSKKNKNCSFRYIQKNGEIIHSDPSIQTQIRNQTSNLKIFCCKLFHCLNIISSSESPEGSVFIYCNVIDEVGIYYFADLLCCMSYNYVYDYKSSVKYGNKEELEDGDYYPELREMRNARNEKRWNFTFVTGDKRLCPNEIERLRIFNSDKNKNGRIIKVLLGSDILSETVDIMNVRQLHILTPHWNYEKINQIIGRIRRVGVTECYNNQKLSFIINKNYYSKRLNL